MLGVVNLLDALEEGLVEGYLIFKVGEQRLYGFLYLANLVRLVGFRQGEEHATHAVEQTTTILVGEDGILKCCRIFVLGDLLDGFTLLLHRFQEGRHIVRHLNLAEVWGSKRQFTLHLQRILALCLFAGSK